MWANAHNLNQIESIRELKTHYHDRGSYHEEWLHVQEWLYTEGIRQATIGSGAIELYNHLTRLNSEIFIISHKTPHSAKRQLDLIGPANLWIDNVLKSKMDIACQNIYFEETQESKIHRIAQLKITHFVDDLNQIFEDRDYPKSVNNFLLVTNGEQEDLENITVVNNLKHIILYV